MAAGRGTRLAPITDVIPKPLVPVANEPVMGRLLRLLARNGIRSAVANSSYLAGMLEGAIGDGTAYGIDLTWSRETDPLGTAGGMRWAERYLRDGDEPVLVLSGDGLHEADLGSIVAAHRSSGAIATMALVEVSDPSEYGVVILDDSGRVTGFQEKPASGTERSHLANTGIYVFDAAVFDLLPPAGEPHDFGTQLFPRFMEEGRHVHGVRLGCYWNDVGTHAELRDANFAAIDGRVARLDDGEAAEPPVLVHPTASIDPTARLIGPIVIGPDVVVGAGACVTRSLLLAGASVAPGAIVADATVGSRDGLEQWSAGLARHGAGDAV